MINPVYRIFETILLLTLCLQVFCQDATVFTADEGIYYNHPSIKMWASSYKIVRGFVRIDDREAGRVTAGEPSSCLGKADGITVSLGDSGIAVVSFVEPVLNIPGYDFAVFENSFDGSFLELAFVEVSSDSLKWVRFPSTSLTPVDQQTGTFGLTNPALINNLAGKYKLYYGTPFDLEELKDSTGLDINEIKYIKIIDVIGCIDNRFASYDAYGFKINDPWPTPFPTGGFDLDAVAVLKRPAEINSKKATLEINVFPNPASDRINIIIRSGEQMLFLLTDLGGKIIISKQIQGYQSVVGLNEIPAGVYVIYLINNTIKYTMRLIII